MEKKINSFSPYIDIISKISSIALGVTAIFYILGFVITNMYFGSLNINNFEILRSRYVLVGIVFSFFLFSIFVLLKIMLKNLKEIPIKKDI